MQVAMQKKVQKQQQMQNKIQHNIVPFLNHGQHWPLETWNLVQGHQSGSLMGPWFRFHLPFTERPGLFSPIRFRNIYFLAAISPTTTDDN